MPKKNYIVPIITIVVLLALALAFVQYRSPAVIVQGQARYQCDEGHTIEAVFTEQGPVPVVVPGEPPVSNASVTLRIDGGAPVVLPHALSADGARYANADESFVFWNKGYGAMILENGEERQYKNCIDEAHPPTLTADIYPLYPNLSWNGVREDEYERMKGYSVQADPVANITDISSVTLPFETYYADLLQSKGWKEDISKAAGGPGSSVIAYVKGSEHIILQYKSVFETNEENKLAECPCQIEFSIFSESK